MSFETPIAFLIFNRPELTARVFARIASIRPRRLLVIADGPRDGQERERCDATRAIVERIDWRCEVERDYSDVNLGCRRRVSSGLDWVFNRCERAIVLEDDCLPEPTFFRFCEELLDHYEHDERIGQISGDNFQFGQREFDHSYYFSYMNHIWGWASWRRAWNRFDVNATRWSYLRDTDWLERTLENETLVKQFRTSLDRIVRDELDTWDVQWTFALWLADALTALPAVNLVTNIGFGEDATHTRSPRSVCANLPTTPMRFPLKHPDRIERDIEADAVSLRKLVETKNF